MEPNRAGAQCPLAFIPNITHGFDRRPTFMKFDHGVLSLDEADALIFRRASSDGECDDGDVVGGGVAGQDAETSQRGAGLDRRRRRRPVPDVDHVSHVVSAVHVTTGDVLPRASRRPRRIHAL